MKRFLWITALILLLLLGWFVINHINYCKPGLEEAEIKAAAEKELAQELPDCLSRYTDPYIKTSIHKVEVLDISEVNGKTYLVFKADLKTAADQQVYSGFSGGRYMLGVRLVEGTLGGISLKKGMEFTTDLIGGTNPAECGQIPDGVFFAFCKDPRIDTVRLELNDGEIIEAKVHNRVVMVGVPDTRMRVNPRFFDKEGTEIELSYGMKVAFITQNENYYRQYMNYPLEWWNMNAEDIEVLTPTMVNGIWVFPDQQKNVLQKERAKKILELAEAGVPVVFVGMKDFKEIETMGLDKKAIIEPEVPASEVEAIYLGKNEKGTMEAGVITLNEEQDSPILMKTLNLRYHMDVPGQTRSKEEAATQATVEPAVPVAKEVVTGGRAVK